MPPSNSAFPRDPRMGTVHLPPGPAGTVLDALAARFPAIDRDTWLDRIRRGRVLDAAGTPIAPDMAARAGLRIHYFREVADEPVLPVAARVLHRDAHLLVADKPHFLPVLPAGRYVRETLLHRLIAETGSTELAPLHRIDRLTAGLVLFSTNRQSRAAYQALFRTRAIAKRYVAVAPPLPGLRLPLVHRSRLVRGEPFFRMREVPGAPNSETHIDVLERGATWWRYVLEPATGRKHQLRVHLAALGAPIRNDPWYPELRDAAEDDPAAPLRLLAQRLAFVDPLSGASRCFESRLDV